MMAAARLEARLSAAAAPNGSENSISSAAASNEEAAHSSASAATSTPATLRWDASRVPSNVVLSADGSTATHSNPIWSMVRSDRMLSCEDGDVVEVVISTPCVDNISLFLGVAEPSFFTEAAAAAEEGAELLPRDSKHAICIHGDGRVFIKGKENLWGMNRVATGDPIHLIIDFARGVITFRLPRTVRGQQKETVADVPGLFRHGVYVLACFGGRHQELAITRCKARTGRGDCGSRRRVRDTFAEAIGEKVAPVPFSAPRVAQSYEQRVADMAAMLER